MLGKLKSMIIDLRRRIFDFVPLKGMMLSFEGAGASDPAIITSHNVVSITRTGVGVYNVVLKQITVFGVSIISIGIPTVSFNIATTLVSEAHFVSIKDGAGNSFNIFVTEMTVGGGNKLEVNPYDIIAGDEIRASILLNSGSGELPPE